MSPTDDIQNCCKLTFDDLFQIAKVLKKLFHSGAEISLNP